MAQVDAIPKGDAFLGREAGATGDGRQQGQ